MFDWLKETGVWCPIWQAAITTSHDAYTHILTDQNILKCVHRSNSLSPSIIQNIFFGTFSLYAAMERGVARRNSTRVTPNVKLFMHTIY